MLRQMNNIRRVYADRSDGVSSREARPNPEPRVTQLRQATLADFPDTPVACRKPDAEPGMLHVLLATGPQAWALFRSGDTFRAAWRDLIWETKATGVQFDHGRLHVYVKVAESSLKPVFMD